MKKRVVLLSCLSLLMAVSSCQDDAVLAGQQPEDATKEKELVDVHYSASFANPDTRTYLYGRKVFWEAGDEVAIYPMYDEESWWNPSDENGGVLTAEEEGTAVELRGSCINSPVNTYYAFYPYDADHHLTRLQVGSSIYVSKLLVLPTEQHAVAGGFEHGLNLTFAKASSTQGTLQFQNLLSLVKFKLTGAQITNVKRVRFLANGGVALTASNHIYYLVDTGEIYFSGSQSYADLVLEDGEQFQEDVDYYLAVAPRTLSSGFAVIFYDEEGHEYQVEGADATTLQASTILNLGTIDVGNTKYVNGRAEKYYASTKDKPVTFCFIPDGYQDWELDNYHERAKEAIDFMFSVEPYKTYKEYFNVYIMDAASNESGAGIVEDDGDSNKDTYFGTRWAQDSYNNMKSNDSKVFSFVNAHCPDIKEGKTVLDSVTTFVVVNDGRYGGRCWTWSSGRNYAVCPVSGESDGSSLWNWSGNDGYSGITSRGTWKNTLTHEGGGHGFGKFLDEYWRGWDTYDGTDLESRRKYPCPFGWNITENIDSWDVVFWNKLVRGVGFDDDKAFPHTGIYEGGFGRYIYGVFRPEQVTVMDDNRPYFGAWQRYLIVKRILGMAGEEFTYDKFLSKDKQYQDIRNGVPHAGEEGLITTVYDNSLEPSYGGSPVKQPEGFVPMDVKIAPPLAPTVFVEDDDVKLKEIDGSIK